MASAPPTPDRQQALRRRHRRERQAVVFGGMIATMAVAALGSVAVYTGVVEAPFSREFTTQAAEADESVALAPCPPEGTLPAPYPEVQVQVLNGAGRAGLAGEVAAQLSGRGFTVLGAANFPGSYEGVAQVRFGQAGLRQAYTLAAQMEGAVLALDARPDAGVDLVVGTQYATLLDPTLVPLVADQPVTAVPGCVPLEQAVQQAPPGPAGATAAETAAPPAEG